MRQFLQALHNRTGRPGMLTIAAAGPTEVQQHASPTLESAPRELGFGSRETALYGPAVEDVALRLYLTA